MGVTLVRGRDRRRAGRALVVGAGGLGSPVAYYLAAAGVGSIGLADGDAVDLTNLHRQILHTTEDVGRLKVTSGAEKLRRLDPAVRVTEHREHLSAANALALLADYDVIIDGSDNFPTRYLLNDACVLLRKPLVHGAIYRFDGQVSCFVPGRGPCYRCLFPLPPPPGTVPTCAEAGVFGVLPGFVGAVMAAEAVKLLSGEGEPLIGRLLLYNSLEMSCHTIKLRRDVHCPACGDQPSLTGLIDYEQSCELRTAGR